VKRKQFRHKASLCFVLGLSVFHKRKVKRLEKMKAVIRMLLLVAVLAMAAFGELIPDDKEMDLYMEKLKVSSNTTTGGPYTYRCVTVYQLLCVKRTFNY
jgi:hypothetical protein